jgi:LmbE family N-acetylglucosaminyl deacetylase
MTKNLYAMVITPHPDDAEYGIAGTVFKWTREGKKVIYVVCTNGDKGSDPYRRYIWHRDHRITGQVVLDAIFPYARDRWAYPDLLEQGIEPHKVKEVLLWAAEAPNYFSDISDTFEIKLAALRCHQSQVGQFSQEDLIDFFKQRHESFAAAKKYKMSENLYRAEVWW